MGRFAVAMVVVTGCGAVLAACGRIAFDPRSDAGAAGDASAFSPPMAISELSSPGVDDDPTLTGDMLEVYFASDRAGGQGQVDIWRAVRNTVDEPWQTPQAVTELNTASNDESPGITADGLELFFASDRGSNSDIYTTTRASRVAAWQPPTLVNELSTGAGDFQPQPTPSKLRIVSYRSSGSKDIYEATRAAVGMPWQLQAAVTSVNSSNGDRSPCLTGSELVIVFASDRSSGMADVQDLFIATRASTAEPFSTPEQVPDVNSPSDEDGPWLSPDGHVLFFSSDRSGDDEIYETRR